MNPAGSLNIVVRRVDDGQGRFCLCDCRVHLQRPPVARLFLGQTPAFVLKTVPYLYSLCAQAQRAAAQAALSAAGASAGPAVADEGLWAEYLHESLWRLLLDWPAALGLPPERAAFADWRARRRSTAGPCPATTALLDGPLAALAEKCRQAIIDRDALSGGGAADVRPLAAGLPSGGFAPADWLAAWRAGEALPDWPLTGSVAAAYAERLAGVARAARALAEGRPYERCAVGGEGWGIGQILTARGILTHAVHIEEDKVLRYAVWAPTDRCFAEARGLAGLIAGYRFRDLAAARSTVEQAVLALDPCLPYTIEVVDA